MADLPFLFHPRIAKQLARNVAIAQAGIFSIERNQCIAERKALRCPDRRIFHFAQRTQHAFDALERLTVTNHEGEIIAVLKSCLVRNGQPDRHPSNA